MDYVEEELGRLRPLPHPQARAIDGVARWRKILVVAYPHNVNDAIHSPEDCARMVRSAIPSALRLATELKLYSLAATLIGTS